MLYLGLMLRSIERVTEPLLFNRILHSIETASSASSPYPTDTRYAKGLCQEVYLDTGPWSY